MCLARRQQCLAQLGAPPAQPGDDMLDESILPFALPAANLGPFPPVLIADWMADRLAGKPFVSEHWYVTASGQIEKTPL